MNNARSVEGDRELWLHEVPRRIDELLSRWQLTLGEPFAGEGTDSWVARVVRADHSPAVLKLAMPHMEGRDEIAGLQFWNGAGTVQLLDSDSAFGAMLLEACQPGTHLRDLPEPEQDVVIAQLLGRLWRAPETAPFRPLSELIAFWSKETRSMENSWPDLALVREGLSVMDELATDQPIQWTLVTDLHAGNVLRAFREPWLVIDPKPFIGDPAFDATQHLLNCRDRLMADSLATIDRFSDLLGVSSQRVKLWLFGRAAAEPRDDWATSPLLDLARKLARPG